MSSNNGGDRGRRFVCGASRGLEVWTIRLFTSQFSPDSTDARGIIRIGDGTAIEEQVTKVKEATDGHRYA